MALNYKLLPLALATSVALVGCTNDDESSPDIPQVSPSIQVAFMPDIHFHDVYGDFRDGSFAGLPNSISGKGATIRTMQSQMESTRLFNENYFAMIAALDDVVERGVKYVALPGDFSDDGQPVHMRGLVSIFDEYRDKHGLEFFAAPGNHDPVRPFTRPAGKADYLGVGGKEQRIYSRGASDCNFDYEGDWTTVDTGRPLPTICTQEVEEWGYSEIMNILGHHGFYPQPDYLYFETPYSDEIVKGSNYTYEAALADATYENRQYEICHEGTGGDYKEVGKKYSSCSIIPDSSYLVEPVEGLWLMAIDANVYKPRAESTGGEDRPNDYDGSGNAGYNMMLTHKEQVINWISDVVKRAEEEGKTLVSFSHFPMTDFYNGASEDIEDLFGEGRFQLARKPEDDTSKALAATGLNIHVGGHMHFNDTGVKTYNIDGKDYTLFNIQAPSLAGYIPAYKLLNINSDNTIEVETIVLDEVERFNELFEHYAEEHNHLTSEGKDNIWNRDILDAKNYYELTDWHIKELTRLRFLPQDWPEDLRNMIFNMDGAQMLTLSQIETDITLCQLQAALGQSVDEGCDGNGNDLLEFLQDWNRAKEKARDLATGIDRTLANFAVWDGMDLAIDFYRLRNADELAFRDIDVDRLPEYELISEALAEFDQDIEQPEQFSDHSVGDVFKVRFGTLFYILERFATGDASDHFVIDIDNQTLTDLKEKVNRRTLR